MLDKMISWWEEMKVVVCLNQLNVFPQGADLGLGPFALTAVRATAIDYSLDILIDYARVVAGRGRPEVNPWGFLLPFSLELWAAILSALAVVLTIVNVMAMFMTSDYRVMYSFWSVTFHYIQVILQQGQCLTSVPHISSSQGIFLS
ncbi:hypothetical protein Pcinc_003388 [Petrolisthes cinctipes]|uniref:Uncharacterized protein n=1 Tax=Petrolisthes cinctipes TaxID=88211 RepID=A0AAE1GHG3_PETCI|nr:hypothetical protein Pcinc_003357 [Petrolisthes cinctipes]KAK3892800.1 hypothetical protein Pcinc_003388 [Petrolisthes cinctipes]